MCIGFEPVEVECGRREAERLEIWLTELPLRHVGVIRVTNELDEDISGGETERLENGERRRAESRRMKKQRRRDQIRQIGQ